MKRTLCVLVLYHPNKETLQQVISAVLPQIDALFIADNSVQEQTDLPVDDPKIVYKKMPANIGIAAAQNQGIDYAIRNDFSYLFYLDQDSIVPEHIIAELHNQYNHLKHQNIQIGAIGPRPINRSNGQAYKGSIKKGIAISSDITEVTELISSASFIEVDTFKSVGTMDEKLFIDGVDHEWCWRAKEKGDYRFFIDESCLLSHQLGEGDRRLLFRMVAIPTPFRTYYQFRNYFWLVRRSYVPLYWKISNGVKYFVKLIYFPLCIAPRNQYLKNIWRGIYHGLFTK